MQNIDAKVEHWKKSLMDLSKRNRLISCPEPKSGGGGERISRHVLAILKPDISELWKQFSDDEHPFNFPMPVDLGKQKVFSDEPEDEDEPVDDILNSASNTNQSLKETQTTLNSLRQKAKVFMEEKGLSLIRKTSTTQKQKISTNIGNLPPTIDR
jgi:hypothetical protein